MPRSPKLPECKEAPSWLQISHTHPAWHCSAIFRGFGGTHRIFGFDGRAGLEPLGSLLCFARCILKPLQACAANELVLGKSTPKNSERLCLVESQASSRFQTNISWLLQALVQSFFTSKKYQKMMLLEFSVTVYIISYYICLSISIVSKFQNWFPWRPARSTWSHLLKLKVLMHKISVWGCLRWKVITIDLCKLPSLIGAATLEQSTPQPLAGRAMDHWTIAEVLTIVSNLNEMQQPIVKHDLSMNVRYMQGGIRWKLNQWLNELQNARNISRPCNPVSPSVLCYTLLW